MVDFSAADIPQTWADFALRFQHCHIDYVSEITFFVQGIKENWQFNVESLGSVEIFPHFGTQQYVRVYRASKQGLDNNSLILFIITEITDETTLVSMQVVSYQDEVVYRTVLGWLKGNHDKQETEII